MSADMNFEATFIMFTEYTKFRMLCNVTDEQNHENSYIKWLVKFYRYPGYLGQL